MRKKILLLVFGILVIFGLFFFSSWTNALVVSEGELSPTLSILSSASPLLIGVFLVMIIALLILISFD